MEYCRSGVAGRVGGTGNSGCDRASNMMRDTVSWYSERHDWTVAKTYAEWAAMDWRKRTKMPTVAADRPTTMRWQWTW